MKTTSWEIVKTSTRGAAGFTLEVQVSPDQPRGEIHHWRGEISVNQDGYIQVGPMQLTQPEGTHTFVENNPRFMGEERAIQCFNLIAKRCEEKSRTLGIRQNPKKGRDESLRIMERIADRGRHSTS